MAGSAWRRASEGSHRAHSHLPTIDIAASRRGGHRSLIHRQAHSIGSVFCRSTVCACCYLGAVVAIDDCSSQKVLIPVVNRRQLLRNDLIGGVVACKLQQRSVVSCRVQLKMGSHVHQDVGGVVVHVGHPAAESDSDDGWGGVERALSYVDEMVYRLADVAGNDGCVCAADGDGTYVDKAFGLDNMTASWLSHQMTDDNETRSSSAVDDDTHRCINDACEML